MSSFRDRLSSIDVSVWATVFIAAICLGVLGLSGWREWELRAGRLRSAEVEMSNLARSLTQHANDSFDLLDASIIGVVNRLETYGLGADALSEISKVLSLRREKLPRIDGLAICDENGDWIGKSDPLAATGPLGPNLSKREYFIHHKLSEDRDAFLGHPVRSSVRDNWIVTVSRRLNHPDGSFAGVVLASIDSDYFSQFYRRFNIGIHGAVTLMNSEGFVMARSPGNATYVGRDVSASRLYQDASLQSPAGVYYSKVGHVDGRQRIGAFERSSQFPVIILTTVDQDETLVPWRNAAIARMTLVLILTGLIAVIGFYLVRQLRQRRMFISALVAKEADFRLLAEESSDMVTRIGLDERMLYVSPSSATIVGWKADKLTGTPALAGVKAEDLPSVTETVKSIKRGEFTEARIAYRTRHRDGKDIWIESALRVTRNPATGAIDGVVAISRDVSNQKEAERELKYLATIDGLTGIANRRRFDEELESEWKRARRETTSLSLLLIDVDSFKKFNDQYGHQAGDACLRSIGQVLIAQTRRPGDLAARYGGEEFALLLPETDAPGCEHIAENIRRSLADLGIVHESNVPTKKVTVSIGGAIISPNGGSSSSLVEAADRALYSAKDSGRDRLILSGHAIERVRSNIA